MVDAFAFGKVAVGEKVFDGHSWWISLIDSGLVTDSIIIFKLFCNQGSVKKSVFVKNTKSRFAQSRVTYTASNLSKS